MRDAATDPNLRVYNAPEVAAHYAALDYLSPCEQLLFQTFLKGGMAVLDLGVGGGRTTPYLSSIAGRYVGVDYAAEMVAACRRKFPRLEFQQANAADLSGFSSDSFDAVVMAFNSMDYVIPDQARFRCLREIHRLLKTQGVLIFSSHNPRAILLRPSWNRQRLQVLAKRFARERAGLESILLRLLVVLRAVVAAGQGLARSIGRTGRRIFTGAFWRGEGYLLDLAHGGLRTHCASPQKLIPEVRKFGFRLLQVLGDDYPRASWQYATEWYYYVFAKTEIAEEKETCA